MAKLQVKDVQKKTTISGKPYLAVKSSNDKFYTILQEQEYIWHLFVPGAELDVEVVTNGKFSSITAVAGEPDQNSGSAVSSQGMPSAWDKVFERFERIEKKLDSLAGNYGLEEKLPKLEDLPVVNLEDKNLLE